MVASKLSEIVEDAARGCGARLAVSNPGEPRSSRPGAWAGIGGRCRRAPASLACELPYFGIEVTYATYRCALRCGDAGGFERAGLGRHEVYRRRDWIGCWKRVRDDDLRADQGHVLRSRRNRQRTDRDRVAADGGQGGDGDLWRVLDGDSRHDARPRASRIRREYHSPPDERPPLDAHIADRGAIGDSR